MNQIVTTGIVLRRINYNEADRIITYITPDKGKISLIAKGVRRPKSKLAGSIELFGESQITYIPGKGDISNLVSARLINNFGNIVKDLELTTTAYQFIQLLNRNLENYTGEEFYHLLKIGYESLNNPDISQRIIKIWFGLSFLNIMGHQPNMIINSDGIDTNFEFNLNKMEFITDPRGIYEKNDIKFLRLALVQTPPLLAKVKDSDPVVDKLLPLIILIMRANGFDY
jgi:recombinational DNA repair protein (RecF pathway)